MPSPSHQAKKRSKKNSLESTESTSTASTTASAATATTASPSKKKPSAAKKTPSKNTDTSSASASSSSLSTSGSETSLNKSKAAPSTPKKRAARKNGSSSAEKKSTTPKRRSQSKALVFDKEEMSKYVIWRKPVQTIYYFLRELIDIIISYIRDLLAYRKLVTLACLLIAAVTLGFYTEGSHLSVLLFLRKKILWYLYWVGLGIASSIGLGTGLHTFLLYLGPFIAQVTLAAYECDSLKFPEPPYPDEIICPNATSAASSAAAKASISILSIMSKVRIESFMWGAGTALGELPPYFMARTHALSAQEDRKSSLNPEDDEEFAEFEQLLQAEKEGSKDISFVDRLRLAVFKLIKRVGFIGILLCASIPNPLYDLAGITCGHFLVPFATFFGATLIGKAIIKMHIQKLFVIFLFSEHHLANLFQLLSTVPVVGTKIEPLFQEWLNKEKSKLHRKKLPDGGAQIVQETAGGESILSWLLNKLVLIMVLFFVVSIVNSLAQRRYKRLNTPGLPVTSPSHKKKVAND